MKRRRFIQSALGASFLAGLPVTLVRSAVTQGHPPSRLIVLLLRGGIDGLNVVVPYQESDYHAGRPTIGLAPPEEEGVLDLDGRFGLHPALDMLMPFWQQKKLAFVHACGSPDPTRSHFDAQDYIESGVPGDKTITDGWMNRLVGQLPEPESPIKAVNVGVTLPRILQGAKSVATVGLTPANIKPTNIDLPGVLEFFAGLYDEDAALKKAYDEGVSSHRRVRADLDKEMQAADKDAVAPAGFAGQAHELGRLIDTDSQIRLAFLSVGGWDTHVNQGAETGQLANKLEALGKGLVQLTEGLRESFSHTVIIMLSEFGRTARENGNGGTDHGHGNVVWLLGGAVNGGRVLGQWPGLVPGQLYEGRDLAVTTDFRGVASAVLQQHLKLAPEALKTIFPGFENSDSLPRLIRPA